jgi:hypothetical protein
LIEGHQRCALQFKEPLQGSAAAADKIRGHLVLYPWTSMPRCEKDKRQGATEEQARIWLAESTGSEQALTVSQLAAADILLFVEGQRLQPHQWNVQLHCPATTARNSCC